MEPDLVDVQVDDEPQERPPPHVGRHLAIVAAVLLLAAIVLAGRAVSAPDPVPTQLPTTTLRGATASLAAPWSERWRTPGDVIAVGDAVLVSTADGTGVRALTPDGTPLWGPEAAGSTCAASGGGAVCLTSPSGGVATAVAASGEVTATLDAPPGTIQWWAVDGDVVAVAVADGMVMAQRWVPPGHRGTSWTWRGPASGPTPTVQHDRTWLSVDGVVVDLTTGRTIARPDDAVALPARGALAGPNDGASGVTVIADGTDVVVAGLRRHPGPAHLLVDGVIVTGTGEVTAHRASDGADLWQVAAAAAFSDGIAVGLLEPGPAGAQVVARDLVSGAELWSVDVGNVTYAGATPDGVVLQAGRDVVAVGP